MLQVSGALPAHPPACLLTFPVVCPFARQRASNGRQAVRPTVAWPTSPATAQARRDKEAASTRTWLDNARRLPTLASVHQWMYQTHQCYAVPRQHEFSLATITDKRLLESY